MTKETSAAVFVDDVQRLVSAMAQLLDDMGKDGTCVCELAKAQARVAFEPFMKANDEDWQPDFTYAEAHQLIKGLEDAYRRH